MVEQKMMQKFVGKDNKLNKLFDAFGTTRVYAGMGEHPLHMNKVVKSFGMIITTSEV